MERTLSGEERIKRAEEIYRKRREESPYSRTVRTYRSEEKEEKNFYLFKKMFLQIAICLVIYFIFYLIQNSNYIFSEEVLEKTRQILSYDIDIASVYEKTSKFISEQIQGLTPSKEEDKGEENKDEENKTEQTTNTIEEEEKTNEEGMGGVELEQNMLEGSKIANEDPPPMSDEEYVKNNFSFMKPIEGIVSSEFGQRDVENPIVSKNHSGIDIAANTGTVIKASMEGTVTVSSTVRRLWVSH